MSSIEVPPVTPTTGEPKLIVIDEHGDLIVNVSGPKGHVDNQKFTSVRFKVSTDILGAKSEYFSSSIRFMHQNRKLEIQLVGDDHEAMRIWFLYMHNEFNLHEGTLVEQTNISRIWHIINAGDKYLLNGELLKSFFTQWYTRNTHFDTNEDDDKGCSFRPSLELACQLPLPCYMFDYPEGFAEVTKWLAYNAPGHISERRPVGFKEMHLHLAPPDYVRLMNAIRGRLKTVLARDLWAPAEKVFQFCPKFECDEWEKSIAHYHFALYNADVYPLELKWAQASAETILRRLHDFACFTHKGCSRCSIDYKPVVANAVTHNRDYFDGLCLDCMGRSKLDRGKNPDEEYWSANGSKGGRFDTGCRIDHGEPSWYHSWCGKEEHRRKLLPSRRPRSPF